MYQPIPTPPMPPTPTPPVIWLVFGSAQWEIWPKMRLARSGIWLSCQNAGQRRKQKDLVILLFRMCTAFTSRCSYIHCSVGAFESLWKSPSNVGSLEWPVVWKSRNLRTTAFRDLREFRLCLVRYLTLNKRFDKWENFLIISCGYVGDFTRFEALAGGAINNLNCQHTREFDQKFSKQSNARWSPREGGHGRFLMFHYIQFHYI